MGKPTLDRVEQRVRSLLRFAKRESYRFEEVRLDELVRASLAPFRPRLEEDGVALELDLAAGATVRADPERLRQVLVNLAENALDALRRTPSPRRLSVALSDAGAAAILSVEDSGPGVPEAVRATLFEPFVSAKARGTGLGLAIARRIVEAHGGEIALASPSGPGAAFRVVLPKEGPPTAPTGTGPGRSGSPASPTETAS